MNTKAEAGPGRLDTIKLVAAVAVFIGGIVAYYVFSDAALLWRILGLLLCLAAGMGIAFTTAQGREFWGFVQGSQIELRKVVWPDRRETINTTLWRTGGSGRGWPSRRSRSGAPGARPRGGRRCGRP